MLGIIKEYNNVTNELINVIALNDCNFDYRSPYDSLDEDDRYSEGYASLGTTYKYNPKDCRRYSRYVHIEVYKNCNDGNTLFDVYIYPDSIEIQEGNQL